MNATYEAAIVEMLESRYQTPTGWVAEPNRLQYRAFWIRDAAIETQALDLAGLHARRRRTWPSLTPSSSPTACSSARPGNTTESGRRCGRSPSTPSSPGTGLRRRAARAHRRGDRLAVGRPRAADPLGLLPASNPDDNELAYGHITGDDLWAAAGLRSAIAAATLAGREDLAAAWSAVDQRFEAALDRAIAAAVAREGHIPPVLDAKGGQDWGNYWRPSPCRFSPPARPPSRPRSRGRAHTWPRVSPPT